MRIPPISRLLAFLLLPVFAASAADSKTNALPLRGAPSVNLGVASEIEAASRPGPPAFLQNQKRPFFSLSANYRFTPKSSLDDGGRVGVNRFGYGLGMMLPPFYSNSLSLAWSEEFSRYSFDDVQDSYFQDLFDDLRMDRLSFFFRRPLSPKWSVLAAGDVSSAAETGAEWNDAISGGGIFSARQQVSPFFAWSLGLFARSRLGDDWLIMAIPSIDWRITEWLNLRTAQGVTLEAALDAQRKWLLDFSAEYESRRYRLNEDGPVQKGLLQDERVPLQLGLRYRPLPFIELNGYAGWTVWQNYQVEDENGNEKASLSTDPTPFFGLNGTVRF